MTAAVLLPAASSLTSLLFAVLVGRRYLARSAARNPPELAPRPGLSSPKGARVDPRSERPASGGALLVWTLGLIWYAISTGTQALGELRGWDVATYRWWYLSGAFYTAAYLGMGSIYLVAPRPVAHAIMACLAVGSAMVAPLVLLAPVDPTHLPVAGEAPTGQAVHFAVRVATPLFNIFGAAALFGSALWGARHFRLSGRSPRALANLLIAAGALVPSFTSGLTRFGFTAGLALGQLLGLWLILAGFLLALRAPAVSRCTAGQPRSDQRSKAAF